MTYLVTFIISFIFGFFLGLRFYETGLRKLIKDTPPLKAKE